MNESKIRDPRMWAKREKSGAVAKFETLPQEKLPIGLAYFKAVDIVTTAGKIPPDDNGYLAINFYAEGGNSPKVKIIRLVSNYKDGSMGLQDELWIGQDASGWQLNAEVNPQGNYIDYPKMTTPDGLKYLENAMKTIGDLVSTEGSYVTINYEKVIISHNGRWIPVPSESEPTTVLPVPNVTLATLPPDESKRIKEILDSFEGKHLKYADLIKEALQLALAHTKDQPLKVGDIVAHPEDPMCYELRSIDGETRVAHVGYVDKKTGIEALTTFPLDEIFDVNVCDETALKLFLQKKQDNAHLN